MIAGIPPWLTPPDPVATYQRGVQIGASIGAQQVQQRLAEQAAALREQENAMQQARFEAEMGLHVSEANRRLQGQLRYRDLLAQGKDPLQAMLETPEVWGNSLTGVAQVAKAEEARKAAEGFQVKRTPLENGYEVIETSPGQRHVVRSLPNGPATLNPVQNADGSINPNWVRDSISGQLHPTRTEAQQIAKQSRVEARKFNLLRTELADINKRLVLLPTRPKDEKLAAQYDADVRRRKEIQNELAKLTRSDYDEFDSGSDLTEEAPPEPVTPPKTTTLLPGVRSAKRL